MCSNRTTMRVRAGFTLVELLVVMVIIVFLAALLIAFLPSLSSQAAEANGAVSLQGWLNIARQKAIRNQNPYGLRLWVKDLNLFVPPMTSPTYFVSECQYIEQPDDFTGGSLYTLADGKTDVYILGVDATGGFSGTPAFYPVQPGDYLEVLGTGLMHSVAQPTMANPNPIQYDSPSNTSKISLSTPIPFKIDQNTSSPNYRILRGPRVIGSETLPLPGGVFVDLMTNNTYANPLPQPPNASGAYVDVLFSPSGSLLGVSQGYLAFWVRQPDQTAAGTPADVFSGSPTVIAVFAQTGLVAAYPPVKSATPYSDIR
jgi:prepilin-type N-terminal cleavage/methylation domain-containing protein